MRSSSRWLGRQDSNLRNWYQKPESYRWTTAQRGREEPKRSTRFRDSGNARCIIPQLSPRMSPRSTSEGV